MASLKAKARSRLAPITGANWQDESAPPIRATAGNAPPFTGHPPKFKKAYAGMDLGGEGQMRHTTFHGKH